LGLSNTSQVLRKWQRAWAKPKEKTSLDGPYWSLNERGKDVCKRVFLSHFKVTELKERVSRQADQIIQLEQLVAKLQEQIVSGNISFDFF
jgi:hypothetical protein